MIRRPQHSGKEFFNVAALSQSGLLALNSAEYRGPTPPDGTGTHRYLLLLYRQDPTASLTLGLPDSRRSQFDLGAWSNGLCGPLSGVQFRTNFSGKED
ncbi:hypothetical protein J6590_052208 [Homalodisca vitripennis]|nr:hypothetical protein J6590_052208 [Homalodisca vitripennis]